MKIKKQKSIKKGVSGSVFNPLNKFLDLNPPLIHRLTIKYNNNKILIISSKTRSSSLSNTSFNSLKSII